MVRLSQKVAKAFLAVEIDSGKLWTDRLTRVGFRVDEAEKKLRLVPTVFNRVRNQKLATSAVIGLVSDFQKKVGTQKLEEQLRRLKGISDRVGAIEKNLVPVPVEFKRRDRQAAIIK